MTKESAPAPMTAEDRAKAHALANFLFPKDGEWEMWVSPGGYGLLKVKRKNATEQAA